MVRARTAASGNREALMSTRGGADAFEHQVGDLGFGPTNGLGGEGTGAVSESIAVGIHAGYNTWTEDALRRRPQPQRTR